MVTVRLKGGLGNQMFQYALGRVLAIKNDTQLKLDTSFLKYNFKNITKRTYGLDIFHIHAEIDQDPSIPFVFKDYGNKSLMYLMRWIRKFLKIKGQEKSFNFNSSILNSGPNIYLDGYWQSPKYFKGYEDVIRKDFTFKNSPASNIQILAEEILKTNSLGIHIRRCDYVGNKNRDFLNKEYWNRGIEYIKSHTQIDKIYVFSDDIAWCESNMKFEFPTIFVGEDYIGHKDEGHMYLMNQCKNFIIANSSFSWWGAWLSDRDRKIVICPKQWFGNATIDTSDLIPENWIRI